MIPLATVQPGSLFASDFRVVELLGRGGMGSVYLAEQLSTGRKRALKLMSPALVSDERSRERFREEARVGARVASDHVVEVVAAGVDDATGMPWLAMELLDGEPLTDLMRRRGALPPAEVREIFEQLGHALGSAHRAGLVHRDVKPDNVFLAAPRRTGVPFTVKVLDFGLAKVLEESSLRGSSTEAMGSPLWMAPEQAGKGKVTPATDVWALGLMAFEALCGRPYWRAASREGGSLNALLVEIVVEPLDPATARAGELGVAAHLPEGFDGWFSRCVDRDPEARFADAGEAIDALSRLLGGEGLALPERRAGGPLSETLRSGAVPAAPLAAIAETLRSGAVPAAPLAAIAETMPSSPGGPAAGASEAAPAGPVRGGSGAEGASVAAVAATAEPGRRRGSTGVLIAVAAALLVAAVGTALALGVLIGRGDGEAAALTGTSLTPPPVEADAAGSGEGPAPAEARDPSPGGGVGASVEGPAPAEARGLTPGGGVAASAEARDQDAGASGDVRSAAAGPAAAADASAAAARERPGRSGAARGPAPRPARPVESPLSERNRAAVARFRAVARACWIDNPSAFPDQRVLTFPVTLELSEHGTVRAAGVPEPVRQGNFIRCLVTRGSEIRFEPPDDGGPLRFGVRIERP